MKIRKGDIVKMLTGKDRGKTGKILRAIPTRGRVVVEGLNLVTKHQRPRREGEKGQKLSIPRAVPLANVALVCTKCSKQTRVGYQILPNGKKERMCKKCKELIA